MPGRLTHALATTAPLAEVFSDGNVLQTLLDVEAALARAQAEHGVIPPEAADAIEQAARADRFDAARIAGEARRAASLVVPLVEALTARVHAADERAARYVHFGATSQDIADTAMSRLIAQASAAIGRDRARLATVLRALSDRHAGDVMAGRTLLQPAVPMTFGLKAATWSAIERRGWKGLDAACRGAAVVQLGGAAGTQAAMGERAPDVSRALARRLSLGEAASPWHTDRTRLAALVAACGLYCGGLGKIARDISLLMQFEVGEVAEPGGGSSAMPQKSNPAASAIVLAAATRLPGLVAASLIGLVQEHERAVGGWQAEWPVLADAMQTTGSAVEALMNAVEGLDVDAMRMKANLEATGGAVLAERLSTSVTAVLGRDRAHVLVREALAEARRRDVSLADAARGITALREILTDEDLRALEDPSAYLGQTEAIRRRLLESE